ncbi:SRPBCC family protein [Rhodoligotrophos defluvii]|uniref:SRPBCC family protein n=1 Tax=Rhodoligotrophos defluvii TaxID=2561934 RepID=UPI0010C96076|nr:SRPBCC family protein [Rhodoligotrophos defluvii]
MTVHLVRSTVIEAPVEKVWALLRDFNGHGGWHPAVAASRIEAGEPGDLVGAVRAFTLKDGGLLREQLIALSDREHSLTYCLLEAPVPLHNYVATLRLKPVTDGDFTFIHWESRFDPPEEHAAHLTQMVASSIYEAGLDALKSRLKRSPPSRHSPAGTLGGVLARRADPAPATFIAGPLPAEAMVVSRYGGPEVMAYRRIEVPRPGPGEVRVRHHAIGVNFIDIHCRRGDFKMLVPPDIPGMEAAGEVVDVGRGVAHLKPGDRVVYACEPVGAYASLRTMPAGSVVVLPDDIAAEAAAAIFMKGLMADLLITDVHPLRTGETILVRGAAGGVGLLLVAMAKARGARVIGVVSSAAKAQAAAEAGCDLVVTHADDLSAAVDQATRGEGLDAVFDPFGQASFEESVRLLATRGHLVAYGQASGPLGERNIDRLASRSVRLSRPNFTHYTERRAELEARAARLFDLLRQGVIRPRIAQRFPLREAPEAHRRLEARENIGGYLLTPE